MEYVLTKKQNNCIDNFIQIMSLPFLSENSYILLSKQKWIAFVNLNHIIFINIWGVKLDISIGMLFWLERMYYYIKNTKVFGVHTSLVLLLQDYMWFPMHILNYVHRCFVAWLPYAVSLHKEIRVNLCVTSMQLRMFSYMKQSPCGTRCKY